MNYLLILLIALSFPVIITGQEQTIIANKDGSGTVFNMQFETGKAHNHPSLAIWLETTEGEFLQTLFTTRAVGTGIFPYKPTGKLKWEKGPGEARRPAALPYWFHKRDDDSMSQPLLPSSKNPVPDAYTGATPKNNFRLNLKADTEIRGKVRILVEVNQPWDVNDYWTNNKYPENQEYLTSCQPALVYAVMIDMNNLMDEYYLNPVGHSHPYGKNGKLYTNLNTLSTALDIYESIRLTVTNKK